MTGMLTNARFLADTWSIIEGALDEFEGPWEALYGVCSPPPYLSYIWQSTLYALCPGGSRPFVIALAEGGRPWAMASFGYAVRNASRPIRARVLKMNESGDPELDGVLLEHNRPLARSGDEGEALGAMAAYLLERGPAWDELSLGWVDEAVWRRLRPALSGLPLTVVEDGRSPYYFIDVGRLSGLDDYLGLMSANTRYQIRRAVRQYGGADALTWSVAPTPAVALEWFSDLQRLHQASWNVRGQRGAFSSARIREFHARLIADPRSSGVVEIARIDAAHGPIGYLYNLRAGDTVFNYQSGFDYAGGRQCKPGLVSHALAAAEYGRRGMRRYDLLMGDSQYKRSLSTGSGSMVRIVLQRRRLRLALERIARSLLSGIRRY